MKATRQGTTTGKDTANNDQWEPFCTTTDDKCGLSVGQTHRTGGLEADCLYCNCAIKQCIYKLVRLCHKEQTIATSNRCNHHGRNRRSRVLSHSTINNTTDNVDNNRHRTNCNKQKTIDTDSCQWSVHEGRSRCDQRQPHDVRRPPSIVHRPLPLPHTHTHTHAHEHTDRPQQRDPTRHQKHTRTGLFEIVSTPVGLLLGFEKQRDQLDRSRANLPVSLPSANCRRREPTILSLSPERERDRIVGCHFLGVAAVDFRRSC